MKTDPIDVPSESFVGGRGSSHAIGRFLAGLGVALFTGPIWGVLGTVFWMIQAFNRVSDGSDVASADLSKHVSLLLKTTAFGIAVGLVGGAMILASLLLTGYRRRWFYSWSRDLALIWCIVVFPLGLFIGLPILFYFKTRRGEFDEQEAEQAAT